MTGRVLVGAFVRTFDPVLGVTIPATLWPLGFLLTFFGGVLVFNCILWFALAGRGTPAPFDAPRAFVADGPYRYVRNPMYLGAACLMAGCGVLLASFAVVLLAGVFLVLVHLFVVKYEEPGLRERFGSSYRDYLARVHRWVPRFPLRGD